ncbi:MAG: hypothetical protein IJF76_05035 [Clostridia bacterium]|nr:hypothetical protein [Clostridia bacterium]
MRFLEKLKKPTGCFLALTISLTVVSIICALYLVFSNPKSIISYIVYGIAGTFLAYSSYVVVIYLKSVKRGIVQVLHKFAFISKILKNYTFRTVVFAIISLVINLSYTALYVIIAVLSRSWWYAVLAGYYLLLTLIRLITVYARKTNKRKGTYYFCGGLLTALPIFLSSAIVLMVVDGRAFVHLGWTVYAVAAFTFYKITMAIINVVKSRASQDISVRILKNVGLSSATVSVLALQTTLLDTFYDGNVALLNAVTGGIVFLITLSIGILTLIDIKRIEDN